MTKSPPPLRNEIRVLALEYTVYYVIRKRNLITFIFTLVLEQRNSLKIYFSYEMAQQYIKMLFATLLSHKSANLPPVANSFLLTQMNTF